MRTVMRRMSIVVAAIMMIVISACGHIQINQDNQELIAKIAARQLGAELMKRHSVVAEQAVLVAQAFIDEEGNQVELLDVFKEAIIGQIDDAVLAANIQDVLSIIKVKGSVIPEEQMAVIQAVMSGFVEGVSLTEKGGGTDGGREE